jgi:NitT/TauT family transport system substrate-binding protein
MQETSSRPRWSGPTLAAALTVALGLGGAASASAEPVHVALGDIATVETLGLLVALENAKERGLEIELTEFPDEEIGIQALISGQADIGIGTPYSVIQKVKAPLRNFYQLSKLVFFPVVDKKYETWQDLDGEPFTFHARGTGTEAIGNIIAKREGIEFGERSYVPGSEVRAVGLLNGNINATIIDITNKNLVMKKAPDRFRILPGLDSSASDEVLFANQNWLEANSETAQILVEELLKVWRKINEDPSFIVAERERLNLLPDLPKELEAEILPYYMQGRDEGLFPIDGGGAEAAKADFDFYTEAGQLEGPADSLKVEDFWYLEPLEKAREAIGG